MVEVMTDRDIRICDNKGFQLDLPNGVTVSVQLGPGNYCDSDISNAAWDAPKKAMNSDEHWGSNTAECAAYVTGSNLAWIAVPDYTGPGSDEDGIDDSDTFYDDVVGHLNVSQVLDFINKASKLTGHEAKANPNSIGNKMVKSLEKGDGGSHGDYRDDPKIQEDERKVMDEIAIDEYFSNKESNDEDSA
jgi:hypothetical protein